MMDSHNEMKIKKDEQETLKASKILIAWLNRFRSIKFKIFYDQMDLKQDNPEYYEGNLELNDSLGGSGLV